MASIIGGRGINPDLKGAAPDCEFVIVKLTQASKTELERAFIDSNVPSYTPWSVLLGVRYITAVAKEVNRPVVVYIPLGSNMGSHTGNGIVEIKLSKIILRLVVVNICFSKSIEITASPNNNFDRSILCNNEFIYSKAPPFG